MASFRLAVLGTLFTTLGAVLVFALIYAAIERAARAEFTPIIGTERADLLADTAQDQISLAAEISRTILLTPHTFYALSGPDGGRLAGNIVMPPDAQAWMEITGFDGFPLPPHVLQIDGIATPLPGGATLFIAEDATAFAELNTRIAYLFAFIFGGAITLGLLAALLIAAYSLKRVTAISQASQQILAGDLSRRINAYGIDDELDYLTEDLNEMLAAMQGLVEGARQVTSDIAHDLRTPLTRLRDHLETGRRSAGPGMDDVFSSALQKLDRIFGIFDALLRIAEIEAGALRGSFAVVDVSALCHSLADSYEAVAEDAGQKLHTSIEAGLTLTGDAALLTQMLVNLIENAIRHCPAGLPLHLRAFTQAQALVIEMADAGPGIPAVDRDRVFQRFVRLDTARQTPGNGLGLALVKAVAGAHGGAVQLADNHPGLVVRLIFQKG